MELTSKDTGTILAAITMAIAIVHTSTPLAIAPLRSSFVLATAAYQTLRVFLRVWAEEFWGYRDALCVPAYLPTYLPPSGAFMWHVPIVGNVSPVLTHHVPKLGTLDDSTW
jgi:hypothetical protein